MNLWKIYGRNGNITMVSLCIVEIRVNVNNIKILSIAQKRIYGKFMEPATVGSDNNNNYYYY